MRVREEINKFAAKEDQPILLWLLSKYHKQSQWQFVATCRFERYGVESYASNRVWMPTKEGRILFLHAAEL